jgi:hypothetical protein
MSREVHEDLVVAGYQLEALEHTVEIVHDAGSVPIDVHEGVTLRHLQAHAAEVVAANEPRQPEHWIGIGIPLAEAQVTHVIRRRETAAKQQRRPDEDRAAAVAAVPLSFCYGRMNKRE